VSSAAARTSAEGATTVGRAGELALNSFVAEGMPDNFIEIHRALIISLAARNSVPAVYQTPIITRDGGLLSYGAEFQDLFHRSARYIDNILRGAKPSELPVQLPLKYFMVVNLKTAKALGLTVPPILLATADEVIE
jgi:putative ABC transport system substrate-binding protein